MSGKKGEKKTWSTKLATEKKRRRRGFFPVTDLSQQGSQCVKDVPVENRG